MSSVITVLVILGIAFAGIYSGGASYIQVTHTMDDGGGECSDGSVTFYGKVMLNGDLIIGTPVKLTITEATWNGTDYENIPEAEPTIFYTTTGPDGRYNVNMTLEECCNYGYFNIVGEAWQLGLSDIGLLHINAPSESS